MNQSRCIVCGSPDPAEFFSLERIPVHCNIQWESREAACAAPLGDLRLVSCRRCRHIFNRAFDPALIEYSERYENSLHFSPFFEAYAQQLARSLIDKYRLQGKLILEIGCGKGEFLNLICRLAGSRGVGFDPSHGAGTPEHMNSPVRFVRDFYSSRSQDPAPDFVICRQVLEHLPAPLELLRDIRQTANRNAALVVFFEVPNVLFTLRDAGVWDLVYEHLSYFSPASLSRAFREAGFEVLAVEEVYGRQFLQIEARPSLASETPARSRSGDLAALVRSFSGAFEKKIQWWQGRLESLIRERKRTVLWGAGSKAVTFLNTFRDLCPVEYAVDVNPRKHGRFLPGCGIEIIAPESLRDLKPDLILIANPLYEDEIVRRVADLGLAPEFGVI